MIDPEQPAPENDPFACSICGCPLGTVERIRRDDYCEGCSREYGSKPPIRPRFGCGRRHGEEHMKPIDISPEEEYYPDIRYLCPGCSDGDRDE